MDVCDGDPLDFARSNCTALKKLHGAFYFHEPPSGPAFGTRDAYATNLINSNDFYTTNLINLRSCQTHEDITLLLATDFFIDGAVVKRARDRQPCLALKRNIRWALARDEINPTCI